MNMVLEPINQWVWFISFQNWIFKNRKFQMEPDHNGIQLAVASTTQQIQKAQNMEFWEKFFRKTPCKNSIWYCFTSRRKDIQNRVWRGSLSWRKKLLSSCSSLKNWPCVEFCLLQTGSVLFITDVHITPEEGQKIYQWNRHANSKNK